MMKIKLLKDEIKIIKAYSDKDVIKLLDSFKGKDYLTVRNKTIVMMFLETGIRNSELCDIKLEDVGNGSILINGKGRKQRSVPISLKLERQLMIYLRARKLKFAKTYPKRDDLPWLFISRFFDQMNPHSIIKFVKKMENTHKLGIKVDVTIHNFRRYYAQKMLENGTDIYYISRLLGHTKLSTTEIYLRGLEESIILNKGMNSPLSNI